MRGLPTIRLAKAGIPIAAVVALLLVSYAMRDRIIATAYAAAQRVLVVNNENRPVPVKPGQELFQTSLEVIMNESATSASATFVVPDGMRLVLENIAGTGNSDEIRLVQVNQFPTAAFLVPNQVLPISATRKWAGTTPTKVIFNAGSVDVFIMRATAESSCSTCPEINRITLTGYLLPI